MKLSILITIMFILGAACSTTKQADKVEKSVDLIVSSELTIFPIPRSSFFIFPAGYGNFNSYMIRQMLTYKLEMMDFTENHKDPTMKVYLQLPDSIVSTNVNAPQKMVVTLKDKFDNTMWQGEVSDLSGCNQIYKRAPEMLSTIFRNYPKSYNSKIQQISVKEQNEVRKLRSVFARTIFDWECN